MVISLSGCGAKQPETTASTTPDQGRKETKSLEAADAVGYEGKAIRKKVDAALDANDARKQQLDQAMEKQQ
jgi:hypothetical protein